MITLVLLGHCSWHLKMKLLEFIAFIKKVEKRVGQSLVCLRSDHGTEFENSSFIEFCNEHCVEHNFSAPRTPQQNGWLSARTGP